MQDVSKLIEGQHVGAIAGRLFRVRVRLEKEAIHADGDRRAGQRFHHPAIASRRCPQSSWFLHAMSGVEYDRNTQFTHQGKRPKIVNQPTVTEKSSPLT